MRADTLRGFARGCGIEILGYEQGLCRLRCQIGEGHLNPYGKAHGGLLFTLLDTAAGHAARTVCPADKAVVTQCGDIHFLRPVPPGPVTAVARVLKAGRRTALVSAELYDAAETPLVYGSFEIFYVDLPSPGAQE